MYKKFVFIFIAALMGACTSRQQADEKTLYVSILPLRSLVGEIVGDDFKIEVLVPPGASPETFEPTPRQFIGLNRAEMIFNVGLIDFETTLLSKIEERGKVVNLSQGIELIAGSCSHAHTPAKQAASGGDGTSCAEPHNHSHAHGVDPHVWTSPRAERLCGDSPRLSRFGEIRNELQAAAGRFTGAGRPHRREDRAERHRILHHLPPRPHLLRKGLRHPAGGDRSRRQGTFGQTADAGHPAGP